jgi:hypothetical protein
MTVTAYSNLQAAPISLTNDIPTVVVQLRLPTTGVFVVWGKVTVVSTSVTTVWINVSMTTLDGATTLDVISPSPLQVLPRAGYGGTVVTGVCVPLQSTLNLKQPNVNEIVDIRVSATDNTQVSGASLIAIPVDGLSGPAGPPT